MKNLLLNKSKYQFNYSDSHPLLYNINSRKQKAERMIILLKKYLGEEKLKKANLLDIGASTGIIDYVLAEHVRKVTCIDIDKKAIAYARKLFKRKNLLFMLADAMKLSFKSATFDIVICSHTYEHVPDQQKLFEEIYRVLKPGGVCYFAAQNKLALWEPHYNLPFLSLLPKKVADKYVSLLRSVKEYYEHPLSYGNILKLVNKFLVKDYTNKILLSPNEYGYNFPSQNSFAYKGISRSFILISRYVIPTFIFLLIKKKI